MAERRWAVYLATEPPRRPRYGSLATAAQAATELAVEHSPARVILEGTVDWGGHTRRVWWTFLLSSGCDPRRPIGVRVQTGPATAQGLLRTHWPTLGRTPRGRRPILGSGLLYATTVRCGCGWCAQVNLAPSAGGTGQAVDRFLAHLVLEADNAAEEGR